MENGKETMAMRSLRDVVSTTWNEALPSSKRSDRHPLLESVLTPHRQGQTFSKRAYGTANVYDVVHLSHGETRGNDKN